MTISDLNRTRRFVITVFSVSILTIAISCVTDVAAQDSAGGNATGDSLHSAGETPGSAGPDNAATPRRLHELTKDARSAMRAEATLEERSDWETAVRALVALNDELRAHPKTIKGTAYDKLKRVVRNRILKVRKKLRREASKMDAVVTADAKAVEMKVAGGKVAGMKLDGEKLDSERLDEREVDFAQTALAQQFGGRPGGGQAGGGGAFGGGAQGAGVGQAGGGAQQQGDYGDQLVDLIERTIAADAWVTVGGPSTVIYHQPAQALIITAPADVHDDVSDLLRQLRAAGGP